MNSPRSSSPSATDNAVQRICNKHNQRNAAIFSDDDDADEYKCVNAMLTKVCELTRVFLLFKSKISHKPLCARR